MARALITCRVHPVMMQGFEEHGIDYLYLPEMTYDECYEMIESFDILVVSTSIRVDESLIMRADQLRIVGRVGSGLEHIDLAFAEKNGVKVLRSPAGNARSVAEHVLGMMLGYSKKIGTSEYEVKSGIWQREANRGFELEGKKIGIVGYGHNGSITAQLCLALGMQVSAYDKYVEIKNEGIEVTDSIKNLVELGLDFLSFHVPYTPETYHYLNADLIEMAPKPFVLINISRGEIVDTQALADAVETGTIKAALLDVVENEKNATTDGIWTPEDEASKRLRNNDNVFITPHIAGYSIEAFYKMSQILTSAIVSEL